MVGGACCYWIPSCVHAEYAVNIHSAQPCAVHLPELYIHHQSVNTFVQCFVNSVSVIVRVGSKLVNPSSGISPGFLEGQGSL